MHEHISQSPEALRAKISWSDRGLKKAEHIVFEINADTFHPRPHLDPSILSGREFIGSVRKIAQIRISLEDRAIPTLNIVRTEAVKKLHIAGAEADIKELRGWFSQGRVPQEVMEKAETEYAKLVRVSSEVRLQRKDPMTPNAQGVTEQPKAKEDEKKVLVDADKRTIEVDGKIVKITGEISWPVFMILAKNSRAKIEGARLDRLGKRLGSVDERPGVSAVFSIKRILKRNEIDADALITRWGQGNNIRYKFNRKVDFSEGLEKLPSVGGHGVGRKRGSEGIKTNQITLLDGQVVNTALERIGLGLMELLEHSHENPIARDALIELMHGIVDEKSIAQTWRDIYKMRQLIKPLGWNIEQSASVRDMRRGEPARYFAVKVGKSASPVTRTVDASEAGNESSLPNIRIDQNSDTFTIDERTVHLAVGGNTRKLFEYIAKKTPDGVTVEELNRVAREFGSQIIANPGQIIIGDIRKKIEVDFKNPKLLIREGSVNHSTYRLVANVTFVEGVTSNQVTVPTGESTVVEDGVHKKSVINIQLAEGQTLREVDGVYLVCEGNDVIEEIIIKQDGENSGGEKNLIEPTEIENTDIDGAHYKNLWKSPDQYPRWPDIEEEEVAQETPSQFKGQTELEKGITSGIGITSRDIDEEIVESPSARDIDVEEDIVERPTSQINGNVDEFRLIPYEASADEVLSGEEAKVLSVITTYFIQHDTTVPVDPITLIRELHEYALKHALKNGKPYTAHELGNLFNIAFDKIHRDSKIDAIKEGWPEREKEIWTQIERVAERLGLNLEDERSARQIKATVVQQLRRAWRNLADTSREGAQRSTR